MQKKILFLVTQSEYGGAQRYIYETATNLNPQKYEIIVSAGKGDKELFKKLEKADIRWHFLKQLKRTPLPWQIILTIKEILTLLKKEKPDVLFLCSTTAGFLGSFAGFLYKLNNRKLNFRLLIIYRIGGWAFNDPRPSYQNKIILWLEKFTAKFKDKIIVNSNFDRQLAIKHKIASPEKIINIYNGIDANKIDFLSKKQACAKLAKLNNKLPTVNHQFIVGTVANFYKTKGLKYLIQSFSALKIKAEIQNLKFVIIGEGKQRKELELLIKQLQLEDVVLLVGRVPNAYKYLKAFNIFILPSLKEGFPWIILEAMSAGLPIISTNVGAIPEIIEDKKQGLLIEPKNPELIAQKIAWLFEHPEQAKNMGIQAKQKIQEQFTLEKMIKQTEQIL